MKVTLQEILTDSQSNNSYPIRALGLNEYSQLPSELNYERINILILRFDPYKPPTLEILSLLEKVSNLKILMLFTVAINENIVSALLSLSSLEIISLDSCKIAGNHLSKILETCTTLQEIQLSSLNFQAEPIKLFPYLKKLTIHSGMGFVLDASKCTQLESL
jgi:hypothetical protein